MNNIDVEYRKLITWFNGFYEQHEQKYRRLHTLGLPTDNGENPYNKLIELYNEAEIKRKRIQQIEKQLLL